MRDVRDVAAWAVTVLLLAGAGLMVWMLYQREMHDPWTRDGQVQADLVLISSPLDGVVDKVSVESDSAVKKGGLLFTLEPAPFQQMREAAENELRLAEARAQALRVKGGQAVRGMEEIRQTRFHAEYQVALAEAVRAQEALRKAEENMGRLEIRAPADGFVMQCGLQSGSTVKAGEALFSMAVQESFRVTGFFRETLIGRIRPGDRALVTLMAYPDSQLQGVVESVARGIARSDGRLDSQLLPQVSPTFDWIRLAQRFPVRVKLDAVPPVVELRVGMTASVQILGRTDDVRAGRAPEAREDTARQAE